VLLLKRHLGGLCGFFFCFSLTHAYTWRKGFDHTGMVNGGKLEMANGIKLLLCGMYN